MLLEVQTRLAQSEEELSRVMEAHSTEQSRLQGETVREREERLQALVQLEQAHQKRRESAVDRAQEAQVLQEKLEALQQEVSEQRQLLEQKEAWLQSHEKDWQQEREKLYLQMEKERLDFTKRLTESQQR